MAKAINQTPATKTAPTHTAMTVASFKANYGSVSMFNVEQGTDFISREECIAHYNLGEFLGNEQPTTTPQTAQIIETKTAEVIVSETSFEDAENDFRSLCVKKHFPIYFTTSALLAHFHRLTDTEGDIYDSLEWCKENTLPFYTEILGNEQPTTTPEKATVIDVPTAEVIVATKATVQPTDIVLNDTQTGSHIVTPVRGATKAALNAIFDDVVKAGTAATKENVSIFLRAVEKAMPERKGMGANGNAFKAYIGEPYEKGTSNGTTTATPKSKFTQPVMDSVKLMEAVMSGNMDSVIEMKTAHEKAVQQYAVDTANEKAEAQKAQAAKLDNKVTSLCADLCKIFGNAETAQTEAFSLITNYFLALQTAQTEATTAA